MAWVSSARVEADRFVISASVHDCVVPDRRWSSLCGLVDGCSEVGLGDPLAETSIASASVSSARWYYSVILPFNLCEYSPGRSPHAIFQPLPAKGDRAPRV